MRVEKYKLTLVVMDAPRLSPSSLSEMDDTICDINDLHPDVVMILGDLGDVHEGFDHASKALNALKGFILPAIGDHDLQVNDCQTDEENIKRFMEAFGLNHHYYAYERAGILFITLSSEQHRSHRWQPNEVFLSDEQLVWFQQMLEHNPTMPTIVQCHAPVFGTHIPIVPSVHVRATNPYVNHNHNPQRLLEIIQQYPQIILWFSGHSQLGQGYPNSICYHSGVYFVHVGVCGNQPTPDGMRHSRVVDIQPQYIRIRTFDHVQREIDPRYDYELNDGPLELMSSWEVSTRSGFLSGHISGFHVSQDGLALKPLPTSHYLTYLDKPTPHSLHAICPTSQKVYVATQGGYVWEYDRASGLPLGTIYLGRRPTCVIANDSHIWVGGGDGYLRKVPTDHPKRFVRKNAMDTRDGEIPLKGTVHAMRFINHEQLFVGADRRLYEINLITNEMIPRAVFKKNVLAIQPHQEKLYVLTGNREIAIFNLVDLQPLQTLEIPAMLHGSEHPFSANFIHITDRFCFFASRQHHYVVKAALNDMKVIDQFRVHGRLQAVLFDKDELFILTVPGRLVCIEMKGMTIKAQRDLEMNAASTMAIDEAFVYVATANPNRRWQEVQVIERRCDMVGELSYFVNTANQIMPQLDMNMGLTTKNVFKTQLRAKVRGTWVDLAGNPLQSREFELRVTLGRGEATEPPSISCIKLRDKMSE